MTKRRATQLLFAGAAVLTVIGITKLAWRQKYSAQLEIPPCFRIGGLTHHYFEPNCSGVSPISGISYEINENGLRERRRELLGNGGILVLGDSIVEGKGLAFQDVISQRLEATLKRTVINGGLRFRGPVMESAQLPELLRIYKPALVIWVLNENDVDDDQLAYSLRKTSDAYGVPLTLGTDDFDSVSWISNLKNKLGIGGRVLEPFLYRKYHSKVRELSKSPGKNFDVCAGIQRGRRALEEKKTPFLFVLTPLGPFNPNPGMDHRFKALEPCLAGLEVLDYRQELNAKPAAFLPGDTHLSPEGTTWLSAQLANQLKLQSPKKESSRFPR